jgi:protein involved in polysaccharide export with SLBB domain
MPKLSKGIMGRRGLFSAALLLAACVAFLPPVVRAQQQQPQTPPASQNQSQTSAQNQNQQGQQAQTAQQRYPQVNLSSSDPLAALNLDMVAASTSQIRAVLSQNPGLMIQVKRLLALQATERGQILTREDLTDQAVYDKLQNDLKFRSAATVLLQRYGYLMPTVNPQSDIGEVHQILLQQRALELAREEQQQGISPSQPTTQATSACNPQMNPNCPPSPSTSNVPSQLSPFGALPSNAYPPSNQPIPSAPTTPSTRPPELLTSLPPLTGAGAGTGLAALAAQRLGSAGTGLQANAGLGSAGMGLGTGSMALQGLGGTGSLSGASGLSSVLGLTQQFPELSYPSGGESEAMMGEEGQPAVYTPQPYALAANGYAPTSPYGPYGSYGWWYQQPYHEQPPRMVPRNDPFAGVPSLYDMYMQGAQPTTKPQRFGMALFRDTTPADQFIPMDLPVGLNYIVGPGDGLTIDLWGSVSERLFRVVGRTGRVALPEVGPVMVSGETLGQVQQQVQRLLRTQFRNISAAVTITRLRTVRVYVVGDVEHPGAYEVSSLSTPLNAEFAAGGPTRNGSLRVVQHWRDGKLIQTVDVYDLLLHGVTSNIIPLADGDTIRVPTVGPQVTVEGMVRRPDIYELLHHNSLADVIRLAGGILPAATLKHIEVQRLVAHKDRTMLSLNIPDSASLAEVEKELKSFHVQNGDIVHIFPIAPYNSGAIYLEGHVLRPGKYAYHPGERVTALIGSYKALLPQPSNYAEIIKLEPPDFQPVVESFNLAEALKDPAKAPKLEPLDTVRIFSRYDFRDVPTVSVGGAVRDPGLYRTSGRVHLRDAIELAGGVTPDANMGSVQVFHYLPNSEMKVISVSLAKVMANDPRDNFLLGPRDSVLVHENLARTDPATVYVEGEVANPGRYPLAVGMRVSDLIRVAGGLKRSADRRDAELTRYDWLKQGQISGQQVEVHLASALDGSRAANLPLRNGDVLTVRQVEGWDDLGASIEVKGQVKHPGRYGIKPGETISTVLEQAGGFTAQAYPYGALLERRSVRRIQMKSYEDLIERVRESENGLKLKLATATTQDQKVALQAGYEQWQTTLHTLVDNPPIGRVVIHISRNIRHWANSPQDVQVRNGDVLIIPKRPSYIMVEGQVYNPTAVAFQPGRSAKWYLEQAGGPTNLAKKNAIFVVRADGSVVGSKGFSLSLWRGNPLDATLYPGDTVVVPEKALGGTPQWKSIFQTVQMVSGIATSAVLIAKY